MSETTQWDAIIIGSGLGGLSAAAAFANRGKRVLVLERLANFGGAATVYRHGALTMEASLHETDGDTVFGPNSVFTRLGLTNAVKAIATDVFYEARGGALASPVQIPAGLDNAHESLSRSLPEAKAALDAYFRELKHLYRTLSDLEDMGSRGPSALLGSLFSGRLFELIADARRTVAERFDAVFGENETAKFALGAPIAYFDDDPAKLSFLLFAGVWSRYVESGSYYFKGGSRALSLALLNRVKESGGDARHNCSVVSILLDAKGRAAGIVYEDRSGEQLEALASIVFAGAAPAGVADMLPEDKRERFAHQFLKFEPSISLFNVSLGLSRPASEFGVSAYSTFTYPDDMKRYSDFPRAAAVFGHEPFGAMPPYVIADYGRLDAGLRQPQDPYFVSLCGVDRLAWWDGLDEADEKARRARWIDTLIADVDRRYPGFAGAVSQTEIATARTMQKHLGTPSGEVYGFRPTPSRLFGRPPSAATSIEGLWISSAYTVSGGYSGAMHGGLMAADAAWKHARK
jgi:phytoene dehydrogenase-like protein